jgi:4-hydroxybenzoate polyprenyltransferase
MPSGRVPPKFGLFWGLFLVSCAVVSSMFINPFFFFSVLVPIVNQIFYTLPPFRFKEKPILDIFSGSMVSPTFRLMGGWTLINPEFNLPVLLFLSIVPMQIGGYIIYRLNALEVEKKMNYKSTTVIFPTPAVKFSAYFALGIGILSLSLMCLGGFLNLPSEWGVLPRRYGLLILLVLFAMIANKDAIEDPLHSDLRKIHSIANTSFWLLGAAFIAIGMADFL